MFDGFEVIIYKQLQFTHVDSLTPAIPSRKFPLTPTQWSNFLCSLTFTSVHHIGIRTGEVFPGNNLITRPGTCEL